MLYAGNAGTPYTASWEAFLKQHAAQVKVISGSALTAAAMEGFDVVIVDGEVESKSANGEPRLKSEKIPLTLNEAQGIPMLMMGGQGGFLSDDWKLKLSWHHG
ncbi:MAG: hypothetical protein HY286_01440 [Planctomycetes bacterium]|nr:hypothetical protein [Planctomycetota bacterium]